MSGTSADGTEGVLLLHGIARRAASLRPMERRLTRAGYVTPQP
jgi:esterase/lipase